MDARHDSIVWSVRASSAALIRPTITGAVRARPLTRILTLWTACILDHDAGGAAPLELLRRTYVTIGLPPPSPVHDKWEILLDMISTSSIMTSARFEYWCWAEHSAPRCRYHPGTRP